MGFISLKTRITLMMVIFSTVTTGLLGGYLVWKSYQSLRIQAEQAQLALVKTLAWQANEGLSRAFQQVQILSKSPQAIYMEKGSLVRELTLVSTATEMIDGFLLLKPDGGIFAQSLSAIDPEEMPLRKFFKENIQKVKQLRNSVLVDLYKASSGNIGVAISTPVFRGDQLVGVMVGILYMPNHAIGNLETAQIGKSGFAYMVNQDGIGIVHRDRDNLLKDLSDLPPVAALKKNKEGVVQFRARSGEDVIAAYATIETTSWGVIGRQSTEDCYAPAREMLKFMTFFWCVIFFASIFLSLAFSEKIVQPILKFVGLVQLYEAGKIGPGQMVVAEPRDEIGLLQKALGRMANTIQTQKREREKAHARALQAERKLAETERLATLGQFSAGLAHELNNPLAVILGSAQLAKEAKGLKLRNWLDEIEREGNRCRRIVGDLLNFAKPIRLNIKRFDLADQVRDTWGQMSRQYPGYRLGLAASHFAVFGDEDRLKQAFINLFKNAMDAMPQGGEVSVTMERKNKKVRVIVSDQGRGISKKDMPKLFRLFFTNKSGGTGLGLAITRSILQAHGGTLLVRPNRSRGVKITLEWPMKPAKGRA